MRNKPLTEEVLDLNFLFVRFSMLGAQTTMLVTEALMAQPKGFICTCALILLYTFSLLYAKQREFNVQIEGFMEILSHDIQIKNHSLNYNSWLKQTYNLIGKARILEKNCRKFR